MYRNNNYNFSVLISDLNPQSVSFGPLSVLKLTADSFYFMSTTFSLVQMIIIKCTGQKLKRAGWTLSQEFLTKCCNNFDSVPPMTYDIKAII